MYKQQIRIKKKEETERSKINYKEHNSLFAHKKTIYKILFKYKRVKTASKPPITSL